VSFAGFAFENTVYRTFRSAFLRKLERVLPAKNNFAVPTSRLGLRTANSVEISTSSFTTNTHLPVAFLFAFLFA